MKPLRENVVCCLGQFVDEHKCEHRPPPKEKGGAPWLGWGWGGNKVAGDSGSVQMYRVPRVGWVCYPGHSSSFFKFLTISIVKYNIENTQNITGQRRE